MMNRSSFCAEATSVQRGACQLISGPSVD